MDNYLFAIQNARESWGTFLTPFFLVISEFAYYAILVIVLLLYMCVDKKKYTPMLFAYCIGNFIMNIIKICACIYRPWITDDRLKVGGVSPKSATGYSFPSGHTVSGASFYGTVAYNEYRNKKRVGIITIMMVLTVLTAFSRNWMGAHSLKDVVVGVIVGFAGVAIGEALNIYVKKNPDKDKILLAICLVICAAACFFIVFKSYPTEYNAAGELICDPAKMKTDAIQSCGFLSGVTICWFIDRKYTHFTTDISLKRKIVRGAIVAVAFLLLYMVLLKKLSTVINADIGALIRSFGSVMICVGLYPALFTRWEKKHPENK